VAAHDLTRDTWADPAQCSAATAALREGPRYLSQLITAACDAGGDWQAAWQGEKTRLYAALDRDRKARAVAGLSPDLEAATNEAAARQAGIAAAMPLAESTGQVFRLITSPDWRATVAELQAAA
jgi:hypothetical protein